MVRNFILRFPGLRALVPRVSRPLLPLTSRLAAGPSLSLTGSVHSTNRLFHHIPARLTDSRPPSPTSPTDPAAPPPDATLSQRLKYLIKSYGWYALGVYLIIGVVDFGVVFAAVNILGADHVAHLAASVKEYVYGLINSTPPEPGREEMDSAAAHSSGSGHEGLYAMLLLAYTVHKTLFLPVRVGLTAAFTPRLVGWLRTRGWAGGEGAKRAARHMRDKLRGNRERD
ncbi:hypothetical protein OBBRIDRAFT_790592 [Obba rivulosa]|uniref:DUF1279 domain-containing protein n=1 Tax=Obba rivulosa TaxID=1052685 RepID=A0A8E2AY64_9APHY|nr:hypothetical protein OBBRIDRAFT_790592 [Obba rivulosa]